MHYLQISEYRCLPSEICMLIEAAKAKSHMLNIDSSEDGFKVMLNKDFNLFISSRRVHWD